MEYYSRKATDRVPILNLSLSGREIKSISLKTEVSKGQLGAVTNNPQSQWLTTIKIYFFLVSQFIVSQE